jgi:hypothetical protein
LTSWKNRLPAPGRPEVADLVDDQQLRRGRDSGCARAAAFAFGLGEVVDDVGEREK